MKRQSTPVIAAAAIALAVSATAARAADLYWQGTPGDLAGANYFDPVTNTSNLSPIAGDALYIGADSTATQSSGDLSFGRIIVGHTGTSTGGATGAFPGTGTVQVNGGTLYLSSLTPDIGLIVGYTANGAFNINAAAVTVEDTVNLGYSSTDATVTGTMAITGGGSLTVNHGAVQLGVSGTSAIPGAGGVMTVDGNLSITESGADLVVGVWNKSSFSQTGGTTTVADETFVGRRNADFTTFALSGGTFNTRIFNVSDTTGNGRIDDVSVNISGGALNITSGLNIATGNARRTTFTVDGTAAVSSGTLTIGNTGSANTNVTFAGDSTLTGSGGLNIGNDTSNNASITFGGNTVVNLNNGLTAGLGSSTNTTVTIADNATVNLAQSGVSNVHLFIGRGTSNNTVLNMTGGNLNVPNYVLIGTATAGSTGTTVTNHSGGTITAGTNLAPTGPDPITVRVGFKIGDTAGVHTYNLSGTGAINVANGLMIVGRQGSTATMIQTGGSVAAHGGLHVGQAETSTASFQTGTGTYNVSGGTIAASVPSGSTVDALAIAPAGTGTFRVIGDGSTINVTGNMSVNFLPNVDTTPDRVGTLAYQFETGESLTEIFVTGTATFAAGSILSLDFNGTTPSLTSYDLLTAADIIDNGLTFSAPAGWNYQIVSGGNGEILQAFTTPTHFPGDTNNDGVVDLVDLNNVLNNFGASGSNPGDDNSDGVVDLVDLNNVLNNFGATHAASALSVVPEPASLSLLALGAATLLARRRRAR